MTTLFPTGPVLPDGFFYYPDFINEEEELQLAAAMDEAPLHALIFQGFEAKRKVVSYGYDYNFDTRKIAPGLPIPKQFDFLVEKVAAFTALAGTDIAEMLLTEYPEGSVINWHRDAPPFDMIMGISLLSDCNFRFRPYDKAGRSRNATIPLLVSRRSLYIISKEARSDWEHSITAVKERRCSITFRTLRDK